LVKSRDEILRRSYAIFSPPPYVENNPRTLLGVVPFVLNTLEHAALDALLCDGLSEEMAVQHVILKCGGATGIKEPFGRQVLLFQIAALCWALDDEKSA